MTIKCTVCIGQNPNCPACHGTGILSDVRDYQAAINDDMGKTKFIAHEKAGGLLNPEPLTKRLNTK